MKGQIFTLDLLLAVLLITVVIGLSSIYFERIHSSADSLNYVELKNLADDWSNIAVRRVFINENYSPVVSGTDDLDIMMNSLKSEMDSSIKPPILYEIRSGGETVNPDACAGKNNVASSTRLFYYSGTREITVRVCA